MGVGLLKPLPPRGGGGAQALGQGSRDTGSGMGLPFYWSKS